MQVQYFSTTAAAASPLVVVDALIDSFDVVGGGGEGDVAGEANTGEREREGGGFHNRSPWGRLVVRRGSFGRKQGLGKEWGTRRLNPIVTAAAFHVGMRTAAVPNTVITVARSFVAAALFGYFFDLLQQTHNHLINAVGRPFGDDWVNYWSAGYLALHGRAAEIYDIHAFHAFQQTIVGSPLDGYHYSYPPVMLLLTAPFALMPYVPALFVWLSASWYAFYRALRLAMPGRGVLLLALATPAVLINAVGGQNGCWTAALLGGGLSLLERRPYLAGGLLGLLICKPQLGLLIPVALIAGRHWRAFAAASVTAGALLAASALWFGVDVWAEYLRNLGVLRQTILEDGSGVWHRFVSVFVAARRLGAPVEAAYLIQALTGALACVAVAWVWFRETRAGVRNAVLVLGTCLATPYLQDYDLVFGALAVAWLWQCPVAEKFERPLQISAGLLLLLPLLAAALAHLTGIAFGPLFIVPLFVVALQMSLGARPAAVTASSSPLPSAQP
jgi:arabinofuranan 3-O-arabinosyltransferase